MSARARVNSSPLVIAQQHVITELIIERDKAREKKADALQEVDLRTLDFERMKQERDEAREERSIAFEAAMRSYDLNSKLKNERDEARKHLEDVKEYGTEEINASVELRKKLAQALVERDKAMEALMKIEDLFIDGTDIYADREKMGTIAKEALEGAK